MALTWRALHPSFKLELIVKGFFFFLGGGVVCTGRKDLWPSQWLAHEEGLAGLGVLQETGNCAR